MRYEACYSCLQMRTTHYQSDAAHYTLQDDPLVGTKKMGLRDSKLVKEGGLLKGAATVMLNRNFMQLKSLQYKELQRRLNRAKLFLETRMSSRAGDGQIRHQTLEELEEIWRAELDAKTLQDFAVIPSVPRQLSPEEQDLLVDCTQADRTQLLVRQLVLLKGISSNYSLPPSESQVEEAIAYCLNHWAYSGAGPMEHPSDEDESHTAKVCLNHWCLGFRVRLGRGNAGHWLHT